MARIVSSDEVATAAHRLQHGLLVAFPTETVYGLGANAFDHDSCLKIFAVKGRPTTDPLICHVATVEQATALWDCEDAILHLATFLGAKFWPGPLTLVSKANSNVAAAVTGGSGFVGVRIPDHPVALKLLTIAGIPVAAPSANTFGHVSPTTAQHVYDDLCLRDDTLWIVDGGCSSVGIESTVLKLTSSRSVEILRRGKVTVGQVREALLQFGSPVEVSIRDTRSKCRDLTEPMDGPGQLLTHYSPSVPTFLLSPSGIKSYLTKKKIDEEPGGRWVVQVDGRTQTTLKRCLVIDFGGLLRVLTDDNDAIDNHCRPLAQRSLSNSGSVEEACREVFAVLRWTESIHGAELVLVPLLSAWCVAGDKEGVEDELMSAVEDRLFRAASGQNAEIFWETD